MIAAFLLLIQLAAVPAPTPTTAPWAPYVTAVIVACITSAASISVAIIQQVKHKAHENISVMTQALVQDAIRDIAANTVISRDANVNALEASREANNMNQKLKALGIEHNALQQKEQEG